MKKKILIFHNIIAPYRIPLFKGIGNTLKTEYATEVYFLSERFKDRLWETKIDDGYFKWKILPGITINPPLINIPILINWGFLRGVKASEVVIIGGITDFTTIIAFLFSRIARKRTVLWLEATGDFLSPTLGRLIFNNLLKIILPHSNIVITASTKAKRYYMSLGVTPEKIKVYQNSSDPHVYKVASGSIRVTPEIWQKYKIKKPYRIILYIGRLIKRKGIIELVDAFNEIQKKVPDTILIIAGNGDAKKDITKRIAKHKLSNVILPGFISEKEKLQLCKISDIFVLPSKLDFVPLIFSEVMGCGLPVITTNNVGNSEDIIVPGKNGYVISANNLTYELQEKLITIITQPKQIRKMKKISQNIALKRLSLANCIQVFVNAIRGP